MPRYQRQTVFVGRPNDFSAEMREAARRILATASDLTRPERQLLSDLQRRDGRSYFATMAALLALSARCECLSVRFHVSEAVRGQILAASEVPSLGVMESFQLETEWQSRGDLAQLDHADRRAITTCESAIQALTGHYESLRQALDALARERAQLASWR